MLFSNMDKRILKFLVMAQFKDMKMLFKIVAHPCTAEFSASKSGSENFEIAEGNVGKMT